jgi:hypothetical protein
MPLNAIENINLNSKSHYAVPIAEPLWPFHACSGMQYAGSLIKDENPYSAEISRHGSRRRCVMNVTMDMSSYEIESETMEAEYGDEILCAGWNPEIDTVCQQLQLEPASQDLDMPVDLSTEVAELFLRKMYSYQR